MSENDKYYVGRCLNGHPDDFRHLVKRYQGVLLAHLVGQTGNRDLAEEVAQETFVRSYTNLSKLKKRVSFFPWLLGISNRTAKELQRKDMRQRDALSNIPQRSVSSDSHLDYPLAKTIAKLPDFYRELILLRYYGGQSCKEIATQLDISIGTITKTLSRAYAMLREMLAEQKLNADREVKMNCEKCKELLVGYIEDILEDAVKQTVESHLDECSSCQQELSEVKALQGRLAENGKSYKNVDMENTVADRIIREQAFELRKVSNDVNSRMKIRRFIMQSRISKFAAAAVIVIGVFIGMNITEEDLWAKVAKQVQQAVSFTYRMKITVTGSLAPNADELLNKDVEAVVTSITEKGMKLETIVNGITESIMYTLPNERKMISLMPTSKQYMEIEFDESSVAKVQRESQDPRFMFGELVKYERQELGRKIINGVEAEGIRITDPRYGGGYLGDVDLEVWAAVDTGWPIRAQMHVTLKNGFEMQMVMEDYEWNVDVDPAEFENVIPEDYTALGSFQMPKVSDIDPVDGLRKYSQIIGGYPKELNITVIQDISSAIAKELVSKSNGEKPDMQDPQVKNETIEKTLPIHTMIAFYAHLVEKEQDPAYYGETVTPEDSDKVLLRWRLDDGRYRVVFGDLRTEDVSVDRLSQLEQQ